MTDWDKELRKERAALDRAEQRIGAAIVGARAEGHPYRWIGERVRMNHETVRQFVARISAERKAATARTSTTPTPPAPEES
jgi:hypothetical protein